MGRNRTAPTKSEAPDHIRSALRKIQSTPARDRAQNSSRTMSALCMRPAAKRASALFSCGGRQRSQNETECRGTGRGPMVRFVWKADTCSSGALMRFGFVQQLRAIGGEAERS